MTGDSIIIISDLTRCGLAGCLLKRDKHYIITPVIDHKTDMLLGEFSP